MQISDLPATKLPIPFGNSAGAGFINTIPVASQIGITDGAASLTDGFPPLNFQPVGSGGVPPFGQDINGILKEISAWTRWQNAGGLVPYDSAFSTAIGGYPRGALLAGTTAGYAWLSTVDNNTTNPNSAGAGWILLATSAGVQNSQYTYATAGGTANALTATLAPAPAALVAGLQATLLLASTNTGAMTLNLNGLGVKSIVRSDITPTAPGDLPAGALVSLIYDGTQWQLTNVSSLNVTPPGTGGYLSYGSATAINLSPANGGVLWINGKNYPVPAGLTKSNASLANSTLYYAYAFMSGTTMTVELSTTNYTLAANGMPQKTGDVTRTLVGLVYTSASGLFLSQGAGVISYFNRQSVFVASNGSQIGSTSSTTPVELNVNARATFLTWGVALSVTITGYGSNAVASKTFFSAIAVDGTVISQVIAQVFSNAGSQATIAQTLNYQVSEGVHYVTPFGAADASSTSNYNGLGATVLVFG